MSAADAASAEPLLSVDGAAGALVITIEPRNPTGAAEGDGNG